MFCAGRVPEEDLRRTMKACGGSVMSTAHDLNDGVLGSCDYFEERQVGGERYFNISYIYIPEVRYMN
jgi:T-complex protein 1 subunit eta